MIELGMKDDCDGGGGGDSRGDDDGSGDDDVRYNLRLP